MNRFRTIFTCVAAAALVLAAFPAGSVLANEVGPDTAKVVGPITSAVLPTPNPATLNATVTVTATVDDTTTGNSNILSAEFSLNGGAWTAMDASDGFF